MLQTCVQWDCRQGCTGPGPGGRDSRQARPVSSTLSEPSSGTWRRKATCSDSVPDWGTIPSQAFSQALPEDCLVCHTTMVCRWQTLPMVRQTRLCQTCGPSSGVTSQSKFLSWYSLVAVDCIDWTPISPTQLKCLNFHSSREVGGKSIIWFLRIVKLFDQTGWSCRSGASVGQRQLPNWPDTSHHHTYAICN